MKKLPLFKVHVQNSKALRQIRKVFEQGFINEGTQVTELTQKLNEFLDAQNLLLVNSCTSAITLALVLAGIKPGAYPKPNVVSTPMTCVASNTPIVTQGANIEWADVDPVSGMVTAESVTAAINTSTRAVIVVAWAGTPPNDLDKIYDVCKQRNVALILDAAHAFGASFKGKPIHAWADYTCYSFQAIKHFTTGDGGALVVNDNSKFQRAKALKWFGLDRDRAKDANGDWKGQQWDVDIVEVGYKFNMNNLAAAVGLSQFDQNGIQRVLRRHRSNAHRLTRALQNRASIKIASKQDGVLCVPSYWVYTIVIDETVSKLKRDELLEALNKEGILAGLVHVPNDAYTAFSLFKKDLPGVRKFSETQLSLPCGWWLSKKEIEHIASRVIALVG